MSWAINASKSKRNEVVPGTSAFFQNELILSSAATRDNTKSMFDSLTENMNHLTSLVKTLQGDLVEALWDQLLELSPEKTHDDTQSLQLSQTTTNIESDIKSTTDLLVSSNHIDKVTVDKNLQTFNSTVLIVDKEKPKNTLLIPPPEPTPSSPTNSTNNGEKSTPSSPATNNVEKPIPTTLHSSPTPVKVPKLPIPPVELFQTSNPLPSSSPARGYGFPNTSPNADLSFIPIASTINPNKRIISNPTTNFEKGAVSTSKPSKSIHTLLASEDQNEEPEPDFDDSFQAISTAIRKSIAGKLSISHNLRNTLLPVDIKNESDDTAKESNKYESHIPSTSSINVKNDPFQSAKKPMHNRTPKRTSVFVSLPSREPLSGMSSSVRHSVKLKDEDSVSSSLLQRLEASKDDRTTSHQPSYSRRNTTHPEVLDSNYIRHSMKGKSSANEIETDKPKPTTEISSQKSRSILTISAIRKNLINVDSKPDLGPQHESTPIKKSEPSTATANDFLRRSRNVFMNYGPKPLSQSSSKKSSPEPKSKGSDLPSSAKLGFLSRDRELKPSRTTIPKSPILSSAKSSSRSKSPVRSRSKSPDKSIRNVPSLPPRKVSPIRKYSSASSRNSSRSPTRYGRNLEISAKNSPTDYKSVLVTSESKSKILKEKVTADVVTRLLAPTTSSAAKRVSLNSPSVVKELRKTDHTIRNKFLTTSLDPKNPPQLNMLLSKAPLLPPLSPVRRNALPHDDNGRLLRHKDMKIKSLMAERQEAATQRVKQKIVNPLTHKTDNKINNNQKLSSTANTVLPERKSSHAVSKGRVATKQANVQTKLEPAVKLTTTKVNLKPTKRPNENLVESEFKSIKRGPAHGNSVPLPEEARGKIRRDAKSVSQTPSNKRKATALRITLDSTKSGYEKTTPKAIPFAKDRATDILSTPAAVQYTPDDLPEILSDDDEQRSKKYLQVWASTPELKRIMEEKKHVDPVSIFGEVPPLNMDDIFESQASRLRGRPSPSHSP